eukprot:scaffold22893_cov27-Tisochrysis_lutea.AAC.6
MNPEIRTSRGRLRAAGRAAHDKRCRWWPQSRHRPTARKGRAARAGAAPRPAREGAPVNRVVKPCIRRRARWCRAGVERTSARGRKSREVAQRAARCLAGHFDA